MVHNTLAVNTEITYLNKFLIYVFQMVINYTFTRKLEPNNRIFKFQREN